MLRVQPVRVRRRRLDRAAVVAAALRLLDDVGLDELTMRRLAERLGVTVGSLYRHVRDKDELLVLLADEIAGEIPLIRRDVPHQEALREMARNVRRVLLAHRDAARLMASLPPAGERRLRHIEAILGVLLSAGLTDQHAAWGAYHFNNLVTESVADEVRLAQAAAILGKTRPQMMAEAREQLRALPADEYPSLARLADDVAADDAEAVLDFGVQLVLAGLESLGGQRPSKPRSDGA